MRDIQRHVSAEGGSWRLAIQNIVCHLDLMTDEQKAAINWHPGQSVSLAVMRLIAIDNYRETARRVEAGLPEAGRSSLLGEQTHVPSAATPHSSTD